MRINIVSFLFLVVIIDSCDFQKEQEATTAPKSSICHRDTIIEHNNPNQLNLQVAQRFIDTSRNSIFYKKIQSWQPNAIDSGLINGYLRDLNVKPVKPKLRLGDFPRQWISLHTLHGELVAYDPMNGIDLRYILTDQSVLIFGIEAEADAISEIISLSDSLLLLKLKTIPQRNENQIAYFRIKKTKAPFVFSLQYSPSIKFDRVAPIGLITPLEHLTQFNLLVDHSKVLLTGSIPFEEVKPTEW